MADYRSAPMGKVPQTRLRSTGHQIRLVGPVGIRVTCRCLYSSCAPYESVQDRGEGVWALFNGLPHDPATGVFEPVDEWSGQPLAPPEAAP